MTEADLLPRSWSPVAVPNPVSSAGITCVIYLRLDSVLSRPVLLVCARPSVAFEMLIFLQAGLSESKMPSMQAAYQSS
mgnify:CR=1 FL=1